MNRLSDRLREPSGRLVGSPPAMSACRAPRGGRGDMAGAVELAGAERLGRIAAGEQPAPRPGLPPPGAQQVQEIRREHDVAVLAALALLDPDQHARRVDVGDLEMDDLRGAQAAAIGDAESRLVLQAGAQCSSATSSGLSTTGSRSPVRTVASRSPSAGRPSVTLQKNLSADTARFILPGEAPWAARCSLVPPQILRLGPVRRVPQEPCEVGHHPDVVVLSSSGSAASRCISGGPSMPRVRCSRSWSSPDGTRLQPAS